ncbi:ATP-binding protein [Primorskyibacter sp. S187A]|uniref:ATP-binding protein n=1 Tax=Primorskyibacter sp. S187A TaxID=3415130 RepID=UPI003C7E358D
MTHTRLARICLVLLYLVFLAVVGGAVWRAAYLQALGPLSERGEADLALASDRLTGQLQRYQEIAVLLADHPDLAARHLQGPRAPADELLLQTKDKVSALTLVYVDRTGAVLASATEAVPEGLATSDYFRRAMTGALGAAHGASEAFDARSYFFAAPAFGPDGRVRGALIVGADIENVEWEWRGDRPAIYFTDGAGRVFISNRSELLGWQQASGQVGPSSPEGLFAPASRNVAGHEVWRLDWSPYVPDRALHLVRDLPVINLRGEALIDVAPAMRIAWLQALAVMAVLATFGALLFVATERRRTLAEANAELESQVSRRTAALSDSNIALRREVAEREEAEARLRKAQAELVQASKLSALGHMSAGLAHELNQPLMATLSFAENGVTFLERDKPERAQDNLRRIADLARRMGRIIRNLRAFAKQEVEPASDVDLAGIIQTALDMTREARERRGVTLQYDAPETPVWVRGGEVRLEQVLVNLISNACDAMADSETRNLSLTLERQNGRYLLEVADTGPGISEPERIFDPFYSTKEVGASEGMGLGLSISYGLVQSFGGAIRGRNRAQGGAVFTVELDAASTARREAAE